jgi:hypothetical protein
MLESLVEKGEKSVKNKHLPRKDINPAHVVVIENFLQASFFWMNLLDLSSEFFETLKLLVFKHQY